MKTIYFAPFMTAVLLFPCFAEAASEPPADAVVDLGVDEVVTERSAADASQKKQPFTTVIVPEDSPVSRDLGEALQGALGVHVERMGGLGSYSTMSIRGASGNQVAVYLDGIKLSGGTGAVDLSNLPLTHFSRIEVTRGSYGAQFGDAAMGGVVQLITPRMRRGTWGRVKTTGGFFTGRSRGGAFDVLQFSGALGSGNETAQVCANVDGLWTDGTYLFEPDPGLGVGGGDEERDNNGKESLGALVKGSWYATDRLELYGLVDLFTARKEVPGMVHFPTPAATATDERMLAAAGVRALFPELRRLEADARVSFLGRKDTYEDSEGGLTGFPVKTENTDQTVEQALTLDLPVDSVQTVTFTEQFKGERFRDTYNDTKSRTSCFFSISDTIRLSDGRFTLQPQAGIDVCEDADTLYGVSVGASLELLPFLSIKGNGGNGFRRPTFSELYYDQGYYQGNEDLDHETSLGFDVGPVLSWKWITLEAAYFRTWYDDLIVYLLQSGFRYKPYNVGKAFAEGVEVGGAVELSDYAEFSANWTYAEVLDHTGEPNWRNNQVPGKPRNQVMARTLFHIDRFHPFLEYHYVGANPVTRANTKLLEERHLFHAGVKLELTDTVQVDLTGRNLTDERALDVRGFPLSSRAVFFSVTLKWE